MHGTARGSQPSHLARVSLPSISDDECSRQPPRGAADVPGRSEQHSVCYGERLRGSSAPRGGREHPQRLSSSVVILWSLRRGTSGRQPLSPPSHVACKPTNSDAARLAGTWPFSAGSREKGQGITHSSRVSVTAPGIPSPSNDTTPWGAPTSPAMRHASPRVGIAHRTLSDSRGHQDAEERRASPDLPWATPPPSPKESISTPPPPILRTSNSFEAFLAAPLPWTFGRQITPRGEGAMLLRQMLESGSRGWMRIFRGSIAPHTRHRTCPLYGRHRSRKSSPCREKHAESALPLAAPPL